MSVVAERTEFTLNGTPVSVRADHPHLLAALREELDVTSPKDGCSPSGQCGCCTVLVDGKAVVSCNLPLAKIAGKSVVTLEGVDPDERQRFADAFAACGGLQCGFCIPGIVMRAKAQIDKKGADLDRAAMAPHLGAHLCRCTGYVKILDAIESVAKGKTFQPALGSGVGAAGAEVRGGRARPRRPRLHRRHARPGHAARRPAPRPTTPAPTSPPSTPPPRRPPTGVVAVFTAADIPGELRVGIIHKDWPIMIPVGGRTSYAGDVLAIVVAETRQQARAAAELVEVELRRARAGHRPAGGDRAGRRARRVGHRRTTCCRGAPTPAATSTRRSAASAHTVHEVFQTQRIEHAFLEPESSLAVPSGSRATTAGCTCTPAGRACGTTATTSAGCSPSTPTGSSSSWCPTAARSAARRTWPTRRTPRSPPGCSTAR